MDVDSAQYASISREMSETGNYLQVMHRGRDYLDKPPLLFWLSSISFEIFGTHNWVFKLGSFLFTLLGVWSTFRLGRLLYNSKVGYIAALILFSSQAFFLFNNDVRTDTILAGSVIYAIWQIVSWLHVKKWKYLFGGALGIALAMMAKGPIGLMVPVLAIGSYLIGTGRWRDFFRWQYLVLIVVVAVLLSPMLWGLYQQFDLQPDKTVGMVSPDGIKEEKGVSGLKFYLWTQSFGRITGENVWKDNSGPFFFVHNFLWSFLPWALLFLWAYSERLVNLVRAIRKKASIPELLTPLGFLIPFLVLSTSSYKLPHYIFVLYPLGAILLAEWIHRRWVEHSEKGTVKTSFGIQVFVSLAYIAMIYMIYALFFKGAQVWLVVLNFTVLLISLIYMFRFRTKGINLLVGCVLLSASLNLAMNAWFYPNVMKYQAGNNLADFLNKQGKVPDSVFYFHYFTFSMGFYMEGTINTINEDEIDDRLENNLETVLVTKESAFKDLDKRFNYSIIHDFGSYPVTQLSVDFLMEQSRESTLEPVYIVKIDGGR